MDRKEAIEFACRIQALAAHSLDNFREPSDCFCKDGDPELYRNSGSSLRYVAEAVMERLLRDGRELHNGVMSEIEPFLKGKE